MIYACTNDTDLDELIGTQCWEGQRLSFGFILDGRPIDFAATIGPDSLRIENFRPASGQIDDPTLTFIPW